MEIDITSFVTNENPRDFSASVAEIGNNAARDTWQAACEQASDSPLLNTEDELQALRDHAKEFGVWDAEEIAGWNADECNALLIQMISGDMREMGMDDCDLEDFDWQECRERQEAGQCPSNLYMGDDGRYYYYLGI